MIYIYIYYNIYIYVIFFTNIFHIGITVLGLIQLDTGIDLQYGY